MQLTEIKAVTLGDAWFRCLSSILSDGSVYTIDRGSFEGRQRLEFDFITVLISSPGVRPLSPDVPVGVPVPTTDQVIEDYLPYLMSNDRKENEEYTYGQYLEQQIEKVMYTYRKFGEGNNQMTMVVGDETSIYMKDPPCLRLIDTRIRNSELHFIVYFRSWDLWGGFPTNLGGIQLMKEYMAKEIGVRDGSIVACSKGLHLYDHHWKLAKMVLGID